MLVVAFVGYSMAYYVFKQILDGNLVELDDAVIPYEKGSTLLWYLEDLVK